MTSNRLVLSLFPGIDLFGRGFERAGYCVVRGPDPIFGGRIEDFFPVPEAFEGIIGGSPCQDFSRARRCPPTGDGLRLLAEFLRCVELAFPLWFLLENVPAVPSVNPTGYTMQRMNLNAFEFGASQNRNRCFQFGSRDGSKLVIPRPCQRPRHVTPCCTASEGDRVNRRSWEDFVELQGLPRDFDLPGFRRSAKYRAVGNGVHAFVALAVAEAVRDRFLFQGRRVCVCDCGRPVNGKQLAATAACRKRLERRRRDFAGVPCPGPVTLEPSQPNLFDFHS